MAGGTEAFPNLGMHCSEETCHQLDFLPFKCDSCMKVFCLDHRSYKAHTCPKADLKDTSVIICPVCTGTVKKVFGEKPELTLKKHNDTDSCSPDRRTTKARCPVSGCRELLTFSNTYKCKTCAKSTCLKHRYASDHSCASNKNALFLEALAKRGGAECATSAGSVANSKGNNSFNINRKLGSLSLGKVH